MRLGCIELGQHVGVFTVAPGRLIVTLIFLSSVVLVLNEMVLVLVLETI